MAALRKCVLLFLLQTSLVIITADVHLLFNTLSSNELNDFIQPPFARVVYFYKGSLPHQQPDRFLINFKEASDVLEDYGVKTATINCNVDPVEEYCWRRHPVEESVFIFKYGNLLLEIKLDSMYNIDAIVSNVLQLVLLGEVPIVPDGEKLQQIMSLSKGKQDILYSYQRAVGTYEHRVFMEVAFVYSQQYKFALSTSSEVAAAISSTAVRYPTIWYLQCKSVTEKSKPCPVLRYTGPMDLATFSRYMKLISKANVMDMQNNKVKTEFDELQVHVAYIFTDNASYKTTRALTDELGQHFIGVMAFIIVNVDKIAQKVLLHLGYGTKLREVPSAAIRPYGNSALHYMSVKFTETNMKKFLMDVLDKFAVDEEPTKLTENDAIFEVPPEEVQDDPVAEDASRMRKKKKVPTATLR